MALADYYLPLQHIIYLFPFTVAQALLSASVCECKYITQLRCTYCKCFLQFGHGGLLVVQAGPLMLTLPVNLLFQLELY